MPSKRTPVKTILISFGVLALLIGTLFLLNRAGIQFSIGGVDLEQATAEGHICNIMRGTYDGFVDKNQLYCDDFDGTYVCNQVEISCSGMTIIEGSNYDSDICGTGQAKDFLSTCKELGGTGTCSATKIGCEVK